MFPARWLSACLIALPLPAQVVATTLADRDRVTIGIGIDGPFAEADGLVDQLRREVRALAGPGRELSVPEFAVRTADFSREGARRVLQELLDDDRIDIVVATGFLISSAAGAHPSLPKPVVGTLTLDSGLEGIPQIDGRSGKRNFTYVETPDQWRRDLEVLLSVADFQRLAVVGDPALLEAVSTTRAESTLELDGRAIQVELVPVHPDAASTLAAIPDDADAVFLVPALQLSGSELDRFFAGLVDRGLPCLSWLGEPHVRRGALVGLTPASWYRRLVRRAALNVHRITQGRPAGELPVAITREEEIFLNLETASRLGLDPSFALRMEATLVGRPVEADAWSLDLRTVVEEARRRSRSLAAARQGLAADGRDVDRARSSLRPQFDGSALGTWIDDDRTSPGVAAERQLSIGVGFTQLLWSEPARANVAIQEALQRARAADVEATELDVALDAATVFLDLLRARTATRIRIENLKLTRANLDRAEVRTRLGDAAAGEVHRWRSQRASDQTAVLQARADQQVALHRLNQLLNRPGGAAIDASETTLESSLGGDLQMLRVEARGPRGLRTLQDFLVQRGQQLAPELRALDEQMAAQRRVKLSRRRAYRSPDLVLDAGLTREIADGGAGAAAPPGLNLPDETDWNVTLALSFPLGTGGLRKAELLQADETLLELQLLRTDLENRIEQAIRSQTERAGASLAAIDLARVGAEAARRNRELAEHAYSSGALSVVDVLDAQAAALSAELRAGNAEHDFIADLLQVERAIGHFTFLAGAAERRVWVEELRMELQRRRTP